jgi:hypothetical protein
MVGERGLEPPRLAAQPPQGCVYTNFTTHPCFRLLYFTPVQPSITSVFLKI